MSKPSSVSPTLLLLESQADFQQQTLDFIKGARRQIRILSNRLDPGVYDHEALVSVLSDFARSGRNTQVQILVRDTDDLIERSHRLARLVKRLPTKIALRKINVEPDNKNMAFLLTDTRGLVYKNDDHHYAGFSNTAAAAEVKTLTEDFTHCWEHASEEPRLRLLYL